MKLTINILAALLIAGTACGSAQVKRGGEVRRRTAQSQTRHSEGVSKRMEEHFIQSRAHDAALEYSRDIYRSLDLAKPVNAALYYPEDVIDGRENLFRVMLGLVVDGRIPAYEYLDGREVFTDAYRVKPAEMLQRFGIEATTSAQGRVSLQENDVPAGNVRNYYIVEKWEFDRNSNEMKTRVEAICPVLARVGEFGDEMRYPMFWVRFSDLRPYLADKFVFTDDDNNLEKYTLDDFFTLRLYDGDIYKTKNLRNLSMNELFPDPDDLKQAQDSIDNRLNSYGKNRWVPTREEYLAEQEKLKAEKEGEEAIPERTTVVSSKSSAKPRTKKYRKPKGTSGEGNRNAVRSVRRRKR